MSRTIRAWPSLWLHETALQLPTSTRTDHRALYHLRMCEYDVNGDGERIARMMMRRAEPNRLGLHSPAVMEIAEHLRTHPMIAEHPHPDWIDDGLLVPFDFMNGRGR